MEERKVTGGTHESAVPARAVPLAKLSAACVYTCATLPNATSLVSSLLFRRAVCVYIYEYIYIYICMLLLSAPQSEDYYTHV